MNDEMYKRQNLELLRNFYIIYLQGVYVFDRLVIIEKMNGWMDGLKKF